VVLQGSLSRAGRTPPEICFRDTAPQRTRTVTAGREVARQIISPAQRKVLVALCRPYKLRAAFTRPASNREIADDLVLSVESVKSHLRTLFAKSDLDELPQNEKRVRLVEHAFQRRLVNESEL
jgi:DNA-binding NarL/FixJ family response regulator